MQQCLQQVQQQQHNCINLVFLTCDVHYCYNNNVHFLEIAVLNSDLFSIQFRVMQRIITYIGCYCVIRFKWQTKRNQFLSKIDSSYQYYSNKNVIAQLL